MTGVNQYTLKELMESAVSAGIVVPAFNIPYLPMAKPVAEAVAEHKAFALMEVARLEFTKFQAVSPAAVAKEFRKYADPYYMSLHLDHIPVIDEDNLLVDWKDYIQQGIDDGYNSVMIDGSRLPFEDNVSATAEVVSMAHPYGVLVEAELGSVLGHESGPMPPYDELFASKAGFTVPEQAKEFVERTGVDWLSVSAGSVHGAISAAAKSQAKVQARLDIKHLKKLWDITGIPLVLHGGSGIQQYYIDQAVKNGIAKINIGTDIRQPYERVLDESGSIEKAQEAVKAKVGSILCDVFHIEGSADRLHKLAASKVKK